MKEQILLKQISKPLLVPGFVYGLRYPSVRLTLEISGSITPEAIQHKERELLKALPKYRQEEDKAQHKTATIAFLEKVLYWIYACGRSADIAVFQIGRIRQIDNNRYMIWVPYNTIPSQQAILKIVNTLFMYFFKSEENRGKDFVLTLIQSIQSMFKGGTNVPRFYKAAYEEGIPCIELAKNLQQYGYGSAMRLMDSSFTDRTSVIGTRLSRDKLLCASVLSQAGIPVPVQIQVHTENEALQAALKIGYPVVVKPMDLDGGAGVFAGLLSEKDVRSAFAETKQLSKNILVEKHIFGKDYRLNVFNDKILWAIERVPAGVTGNGEETIEALVEKMNSNPQRGNEGTHALLKRLVLDDEAIGLLDEHGYTAKSVLEDGIFVPLRRKANISTGGTPVSVMDKIHPDNYFLAVRAAQILNLDLAGIDLITQDISVSWKKTAGAICEVNGQPQLGGVTSAHVYAEVLNTLVPNKGHIPIVVVFGDTNDAVSSRIRRFFETKGLRIGLVDANGVFIGNKRISDDSKGIYAGGKMLLMDKNVDAIVVCMNDTSVLMTGLPFDYYDVLVLAGSHLHIPKASGKDSAGFFIKESLNCILPACRRSIIDVRGFENSVESRFTVKQAKHVSLQDILKVMGHLFTDQDVKNEKK